MAQKPLHNAHNSTLRATTLSHRFLPSKVWPRLMGLQQMAFLRYQLRCRRRRLTIVSRSFSRILFDSRTPLMCIPFLFRWTAQIVTTPHGYVSLDSFCDRLCYLFLIRRKKKGRWAWLLVITAIRLIVFSLAASDFRNLSKRHFFRCLQVVLNVDYSVKWQSSSRRNHQLATNLHPCWARQTGRVIPTRDSTIITGECFTECRFGN